MDHHCRQGIGGELTHSLNRAPIQRFLAQSFQKTFDLSPQFFEIRQIGLNLWQHISTLHSAPNIRSFLDSQQRTIKRQEKSFAPGPDPSPPFEETVPVRPPGHSPYINGSLVTF